MAVSCNPIDTPPTPGPVNPQDTTSPVNPVDTLAPVDPVGPVTPTTIIDTTYAIGTSGATLTLILTSACEWSATVADTSAAWCTVSPQYGQKGSATITVAIEANKTYEERSATILIKAGDSEGKIVVVQECRKGFEINLQDYVMPPLGGHIDIDLQTNMEYSCRIEGGDWVAKTDSVATKGLTACRHGFEVARNTTGAERSCNIVFEGEGISKTLKVLQHPAYVTLSTGSITFGKEASSEQVAITSNVPFEVVLPSENWLWKEGEIVAEEGKEKTSRLTFNAVENPFPYGREAQVVFRNADYQICDTLLVSQGFETYFSVSEKQFSFGPEGGEAKVTVATNLEYTCTLPEEAGWIKAEKSGGEYIFIIEKNTSKEGRKASISFIGGSFTEIVELGQDGVCLEASLHEARFGINGGETEVKLAHNIPYEVVMPSVDWICKTTASADQYLFTVAANSDSKVRECTVVFLSESFGVSDTLKVFQERSVAFDIPQKQFVVSEEGGKVAVTVNSNIEYEYALEGAPDWICEESPLVFSVAANPSPDKREATIRFTSEAEGISETVTISQKQKSVFTLKVTPASVPVFAVEGGTAEFVITADVPYIIEMPAVQWVSRTDGSQDGKLSIKVEANTGEKRECSIVVSSADYGLSETINISQSQKDRLSISPVQFDLGPEGGEIAIDVDANISYTATPRASWIAGIGAKSTSARKVFSVGLNTTTSARESSISFEGNGLSASAVVNQAAPVLSLSKNKVEMTAEGGSIDIDIESNIGYSCSSEKSWLGFTENSGKLRLTVAENTTGAKRSCTFTVKNADFSIVRTVEVVQEQNNVLEVSKTSYEFGSEGGTFTPTVNANIDYTVNVPVSWITRDGSKFTVAANEETSPRSATITYSGSGLSRTIEVSQEAYVEPEPEPLDGRVSKLQTHTEGNGVNVVIMGDAFTEAQNTDGTYEKMMKRAMEAFFNVEPYTTFRNLFDVYMVNVVSESSDYGSDVSKRKLKTVFGTGTSVSGDDAMCKRYALHAVKPDRDDWQTVRWESDNLVNTEVALGNTLVIVIMNKKQYSGTCYMGVYWVNDPQLTFTQGNSVAYFGLGREGQDDDFEALLQHEACGHGFGYLGDEYCYSDTGTVPQDEIDDTKYWQDNFYAMLNIDFTSDPAEVKWNHFLADERYDGDGLGVFEGAGGYYEYGVYRPTDNSIMRDNVGGFNAPSREVIYKRLHKLAYGKTWTYDYEEFVAYDAVNRKTATKVMRNPQPKPHTGRSVITVCGVE